MQKDIMEREIAEIIKGFRQDSIEIEMNQEHVHKWISQFSPDTQNIILEETLHILKEWYFPKDKINLFLDKMMDYLKSENENATDEELSTAKENIRTQLLNLEAKAPEIYNEAKKQKLWDKKK